MMSISSAQAGPRAQSDGSTSDETAEPTEAAPAPCTGPDQDWEGLVLTACSVLAGLEQELAIAAQGIEQGVCDIAAQLRDLPVGSATTGPAPIGPAPIGPGKPNANATDRGPGAMADLIKAMQFQDRAGQRLDNIRAALAALAEGLHREWPSGGVSEPARLAALARQRALIDGVLEPLTLDEIRQRLRRLVLQPQGTPEDRSVAQQQAEIELF